MHRLAQLAPPVELGSERVAAFPLVFATIGGGKIGPDLFRRKIRSASSLIFWREVDEVGFGDALAIELAGLLHVRLRRRIPLAWHIALFDGLLDDGPDRLSR